MSEQKGWASQLARPHGRSARLVAVLLESANRKQNAAVVHALAPSSTDRILEIGFGGGGALRSVLAGPAQTVVGLELSEEMVARARRVFSKPLSEGRLRLEQGNVDRLPFEDASFDGVYAVNCIYFWPDPVRGLEEIRRVLNSGGRIVLGVDPRSKKMFKDPHRGFDADDADNALKTAGFVNTTRRESRRHHWIVGARRP